MKVWRKEEKKTVELSQLSYSCSFLIAHVKAMIICQETIEG